MCAENPGRVFCAISIKRFFSMKNQPRRNEVLVGTHMGNPICVLNHAWNERKAFIDGKERCVRKTQEGFSARFQSNGFSHEKPTPQERSSCGDAYGNTVCVLNHARNERTKPPERGETMRALELPPRLRLIAGWVPEGAYLADVGTDHGYLPTWLRLHGKIQGAVASDLRPGPLERAKVTGSLYGTDNIEYRLCNGLAGIRPSEVDTVTIAGMGGETILSILKAAPWTADGQHTLLLQPQSHEEMVRQYLAENGFAITREALVRDRGTLYTVMEAKAGKMELSLSQVWGGVRLAHDPLADRYIVEKIVRTQMALAGAKRSTRLQARTEELRETLTALLRAREEWRHANRRTN